jgi:vacuolar iron transporter family protein
MDEIKRTGSKYIKSIVYGGLDGIITTFAVVSAVIGASLSPAIVLIMGFANLLADGLSMGFGDYLSSKADSEKERTHKRLNRKPLLGLLRKHVTQPIANKVVDLLAKNVDVVKEAVAPCECEDEGELSPVKNGLITFGSFCIFGIIPLLFFLLAHFFPSLAPAAFIGSIILTAGTLTALGLVKAYATGTSYVRSGLETLFVGGIAAVASYYIGFLISLLI